MEQPKLLDRVRASFRARHYSRRTEESYVHWIRRYIVFHGKRHPANLGAPEVTAFLTMAGNGSPRCGIDANTGRVVLPDALERKFPHAATEWRWQFVFPAGRICRDPRYGPPSRFHLHESVIQRAVADAGRRAVLTKRVSCHTFRSVSA